MSWENIKLGKVITHRKEFITIDNTIEYKRCRVQVNKKGVVLRDTIKGIYINTKKQQVCKEGDFLVAEIDAKVGGYGFVGKDLEGAIVSSHYFLFDVDETKMLRSYLAWIIKTDIIQEQISSKGSTNYAAIRPSHVLNFEIPLPSIEEQIELVKRLNGINKEYLSINEELDIQQSYLQQLRQAILQEAVQGKLTQQNKEDEPADKLLQRIKAEKQKLIAAGKLKKEKELPPITKDEPPFELPKGWAWCRLLDLCIYIQRGKSPVYVEKSSVPVLSQKCIRWGGLDFKPIKFISEFSTKKYESQRFLAEGDLLWNSTGDGTLGRITFYKQVDIYNKVVVDSHITIVRLLKDFVEYKYILFLLSSPFVQNNLIVSGSTKQTELNTTVVKNQLVPLPPISEQQRIVIKVELLLKMVKNLEHQVALSQTQAQQLLQAVLKEAFSGKNEQDKKNDILTLAAS